MNLCLGICLPGLPKHEVHFCFVHRFFFFPYYPLQVWKYKWPWKNPEGIWFSFLTLNWLLLLKRKLGEIYSPERWVEKMMLFQCKIIPGLCVCVCVCGGGGGGDGRGEEEEEVETEGGLREMPISMGNSIWQLHGDKPISMDCQGVLYELATCPLWIGMGLTSSFQTLHQTANGHMIMIFQSLTPWLDWRLGLIPLTI